MLSREPEGQLDGEESDARARRGAPPGDMIRVLVIAKDGTEGERIVQSLRALPGIALEALQVATLPEARPRHDRAGLSGHGDRSAAFGDGRRSVA